MKILLLNHFPLAGSGSGVYTKTIAEGLAKNNHEICIIMPENEKIKTDNSKIKIHPVYFKNKEKIEGALPFNFPCFTTHPRSTNTFSNLNDEQIKLYIQAFDQAIKEEIEKFKPDIIHSGHIWILPAIASKYNIPLIITTHGTDLIGYENDINFRKYANEAFNKAYKIITISKKNNELIKKIFNQDKCILIPNGYDADIFYQTKINKDDFLKQFNIENKYDKIVSFVGKFTYIKGIDILLKAATLYENNNILTILAGDGELFDDMKKLAKKLNLKNIFFIKNQPQDILNKLYNIADVSIISSRSEAFGLVAIEAMACGTPVIGSDIGGISDIITDDTGMLFESENYHDLATKIKQVINNKSFDRNYIAKYTKDKFSQENFTKKLIDIYEKATLK